jgi:hypothetical protein
LRFAVRRPGIPESFPRSHGVPRRDVPGRVEVSVAGETAGSAPEDGLALARLPVHVPARRAPLARERGFDLLYSTPGFLLQSAYKQPPPGSHYLAVEPGLGADVSARVLRCAFRGPSHVCDLQVLDPDHVEAPGDVRTGLLHPVLPPVRLAGAQPGDRALDPSAAIRSPFGPGQLPLQAPQPGPFPPSQAGTAKHLPGRQGRGDRHAPVNAHYLAVAWRRNWRGDHGKRDVPPARWVHRHAVGLSPRRDCSGPAEPHPPGLRYPDFTDSAGQATHVPLPPTPPHDPEPLIPPSLAPQRPSGRVVGVVERGHRLGEVSQRLLLHHLGACGQPWILGPGGGELPTLLQVARSARAAPVPALVLLDGQVPHVPGMGTVLLQHGLLGRRGKQPVSGHTNTLSIIADISREVKRRVSPA